MSSTEKQPSHVNAPFVDSRTLNINRGVPNVDGYFPLNEPAVGTIYTDVKTFPRNANPPLLFTPLTIKGVTFKNRIWVSPMCQYSSDNGHATDWHLVHLGGFASRGVGAIMVEATAIVPEGRISPEDMGIWSDSHIAPLRRIVNFAHSQETMIGIQLAHSGRKASTYPAWVYARAAKAHQTRSHVVREEEKGWTNVYGPSEIAFSDTHPKPRAMTEKDIERVETAFIAAVDRCKKIGFDFIEIHSAHGYLLHSFLSPLSNQRTDAYGGDLTNRMRFPLRLIKSVREAWPEKPLFVRISATDWAEDPEQDENGQWRYWGIRQSKVYVEEMKKIGVDLVDISSGGICIQQKIPVEPNYQVQFAEVLKRAHPEILIGAVGLLTDPNQVESHLKNEKADVAFLARELMRDPSWAITAARALGVAIKPANQYEDAWPDMQVPRVH